MNINVLNNQHKYKATHEDSVVSLDKFIYVQDKRSKYILFRFYNGLNNDISAISFDVYFYTKGKVVGMKKMRDVTVHGTSQNCFYFTKKISVPRDCDSFAIDNITSRAGFIEYTEKDGQIEKAFYDLSAIPDTAAAQNALGSKHVVTDLKRSAKTSRVMFMMFAFFIAFIIALIPLVVIQNQRDTCVTFTLDNVEYKFLDNDRDDGDIAITAYNGTAESIKIPATIEGLHIVAIADNAFKGNTHLKTVTIEGEVTVGKSAFEGCSNLTTIDFSKVTTIGDSAFANTAITSLDCTNCSYIGSNAFANCTLLSSVSFNSDKTLTIGATPFNGCGTVDSVTILQNIDFENDEETMIFGNTAVNSMKLKKYPFLTETGDYINIANIMKNLSSLYIESIDTIPAYFCMGMTHLKSIEVKSITDGTVGDSAFNKCSNLDTFTSPAIKNIGNSAFAGTILNSFNFESVEKIGDSAFENATMTINLNKAKKLNEIGARAFAGCKGITNVTFTTVVTLHDGAFQNCTNLEEVSLANITSIPDYFCDGCSSLKKLTLSNTLTSIGKYAFTKNALTSIVIPDSVSYVGFGALEGSNPTSLTLPFVGESQDSNNFLAYTFGTENCYNVTHSSYPTSLQSVTVRNAETIGEYAFSSMWGLKNISISGTCSAIGAYSFSDCKNLTTITIPSTVTELAEYAFSDCTSLSSVNLPKSLGAIRNYAFNNCSNIKSISLPQNLSTIGDGAFTKTGLTILDVPSTVTSIGLGAFEGCELEGISLPNTISTIKGANKSVGYYFGAENMSDNATFVPDTLTTIVITSGKVINSNMFYGLQNVTNIALPENLTTIGANAFENCTGLTTLTIPATVTSILSNAFSGCTGIASISIPASVKTLCDYAFSGCSALNAINMDDGLESIGKYSFQGVAVTAFDIPSTVTTIGAGAFASCNALTEITLPDCLNQKSIDNKTFGYYFGATKAIGNADAVPATLKTITILTNKASDTVEIYERMFYGLQNIETVVLPDTITTIGLNAFENCTSLKTIDFKSNLKTISNYAFKGSALETVVLPVSVKSIGLGAFEGCPISTLKMPNCVAKATNNQTIGYFFGSSNIDNNGSYIPDTLLSIEILNGDTINANMFSGITSVVEIILPSTATTIENNAFSGCTSLTDITIPSSVKKIYEGAFSDCTSLTEIVIPSSVTLIDKDIFKGCDALETLTLSTLSGDSTNMYLGYIFGLEYMSGDNDTLKNVTITNMEKIPSYAFVGFNALSSVTLNEGIESIENYAFYNLASLKDINIPSTVTSIMSYAFSGTPIESITIPKLTTSISDYAFTGCNHLYVVYNLSDLAIVKGSDTFGNVAKYAIMVYNSVEDVNKITSDDGYTIIESSDGYYLIDYDRTKTSITLPTFNGITYKVASYLFYGNENITSVSIPMGVTDIGDYAFSGCSSISKIDMSKATGLLTIGKYAFNGTLVEELVLPKNLTNIDEGAFKDSKYLYYVSLPASILSIGTSAFEGSTSLYIVNNLSSLSGVTAGSIENGYVAKYASTIINVDSSLLDSYTLKNGVTVKYADNIHIIYSYSGEYPIISLTGIINEIYASSSKPSAPVFIVSRNAFKGSRILRQIELGSEITSIPEYAFADCTGLVTFIATNSNITTLPSYVLSGCTSLTSVQLPSGLLNIESYAFDGCTALQNISLPSNITELKSYVFNDCTGLKEITLPSKLATIRSYAFNNCSALEWITLPSTVETINDNAFVNCIRLYEVNNLSSNISLANTKGTTKLGNIALYALLLRLSDDGNHIEQYTDENGFHFYKEYDKWYLKEYDNTKYNKTVITLPDKIGTLEAEYTVIANAINAKGATGIVIPLSVKKVEDGAFTNLGTSGKLYYKGTSADWATLNVTEINGWSPYMYTSCVHTDYTWTYNKSGELIDSKNLTVAHLADDNCTKADKYSYTCNVCGKTWEGYDGSVDPYNHVYDENGKCVVCGRTKIGYSESVTWATVSGFNVTKADDGICTLTSTNHTKGSTATITINLTANAQLVFDWMIHFSGVRTGSIVVECNGTELWTASTSINSMTTYKYSFNSGDTITITYKNTIASSSTDGLTISDLQLIKVVD